MTANLPYVPPMNTDNDYYQTVFSDLFVSDAMLLVQYMLEEKPVLCFHYIDSTIRVLPKVQASSHLLWPYSPVCQSPRRQVFS